MAGDWIKFETTTPDKPEVFAIAEQLQLDPDAVVGKLVRVWIWADSQTEDGRVTHVSRGQRDICHASVTHKIVDRLVGMPGFAAAMESVGWLTPDGSIPGFDRHNGETAKKRALARERKARQRAGAVTDASRDQRDTSVTREEKRREIKKEDPSDLPKKAPNDPNRREKKTKRAPDDFQLTDSMLEWAAEQCPSVDVGYHTQKFLDHTFGTARQDWTATWRNWLRTEQERRHEADQRALARPGRGETVDDKLRRLRGEGQSRMGVADGDIRGPVLAGVRFGA